MRSTYDLRQSQDYHSQDRLTHLEHSGNYIPRPFRIRWSSGNCNSTRCANCSDIVYANERIDAVGKVFHRLCFKCNDCQRLLDRGTACDHNRFQVRACLVLLFDDLLNVCPIHLHRNDL
ncbi:unnamed protein product [Schistosoma mattheei]|uniref:Uncharacterized protein n=1 Tax=Schistosoma mattheei TaxID=31246 RepID=A0A183P327_9TREM|nr:unnamed protein product [Schistosoma mattheei]